MPAPNELMTSEEAAATLRLFLEVKPVRGRYTLYESERRAIVRLLIDHEQAEATNARAQN